MLTQDTVLLLLLACAVTAGAIFGVMRHLRRARLRLRRRRILDELNETEVVDVELQIAADDYSAARVVRQKGHLSRRGTSFLVAPVGAGQGVATGGDTRIRFQQGGIAHELPCQCTGRKRLSAKGRRQLDVEGNVLLQLTPAGVIVKRERRDMMRFYVGDSKRLPRGTTDARAFVDLRAWLLPTDLDVGGETRLRRKMRTDAFRTRRPDGVSTPPAQGATRPEQVGDEVDVLDFSGTGLRVECDVAPILRQIDLDVAADTDVADAIQPLADMAWLVMIEVKVEFPPSVQPLEPAVPGWTWMLAEVARISMVQTDDDAQDDDATEQDLGRMRLGLALLYQPLEIDPATGLPSRWELLKGHSEADDFVAIHNALNLAAAQMQAEAPVPNRK